MRVCPAISRVAVMSVFALVLVPTAAANPRPEVVVRIDAGRFFLELDDRMHSRLVERRGGEEIPLGPMRPTEVVTVAGREVADFRIAPLRAKQDGGAAETLRPQPVNDGFGAGTRTVLHGEGAGLRKELTVTTYAGFPGVALIDVAYVNAGSAPVTIDGWANRRYLALPGTLAGEKPPAKTADKAAPFWSYQPGSYEDRRDWVRPLKVGFKQDNFLGMNASDYGGGTPVVAIWRRDVGIAVGHLATAPQLVSLPVVMRDARGAEIAVAEARAATLAPGQRRATLRTFVSVDAGDHFAALARYRGLMERQGVRFPKFGPEAYEPIWCGWGYEREVTAAQIRGTLPKAKALGFSWAVLDDGWQRSIGDWQPAPAKFPAGDADMKALTGAMRAAGLKPMLWWAPLAMHPKSALAAAHPDYLLLGADGQPQKISWWDAHLMCPAYAPVKEHTRALVTTMTGAWDYEGLKLDGQHLNGVPPCHNPKHGHRDPRESVTALPGFFKDLEAAARAKKPAALIELCPCGTSYAFTSLPYTNLPAASDPLSSWQVRLKGKTLKALMGPSAPYFGDHVELSDGGDDFASTVGVGGVVGTQFTLPKLGKSKRRWHLTARKERLFRKWVPLYRDKLLSRGEYLGALYDIGFDRPEAHAIRKDGRMHYAFFAKRFAGKVELRGLEDRAYQIRDYVAGRVLGRARGPVAELPVRFARNLLLEAIPVD